MMISEEEFGEKPFAPRRGPNELGSLKTRCSISLCLGVFEPKYKHLVEIFENPTSLL